MDNNYTKDEMDLKYELILTKLDAIHEQTKRTNGRVSVLETVTEDLKLRTASLEQTRKDHNKNVGFWKDKSVWIVGSIVFTIFSSLLGYIISKL